MAVKIVATQTCDVCGDKIGDVVTTGVDEPLRKCGIRVSEIEVGPSGSTVTDLFEFEEACTKCSDAVKALFAKLTKKQPAAAPRPRRVRTAVAAAPAEGDAPKRKRGRPRKNPDAEVTPSVVASAVNGAGPVSAEAPF